jgi:hypothetical protein
MKALRLGFFSAEAVVEPSNRDNKFLRAVSMAMRKAEVLKSCADEQQDIHSCCHRFGKTCGIASRLFKGREILKGRRVFEVMSRI